MTNETLEVLRTRRSRRHYSAEQIKEEELVAVLEAGTYAPTGFGSQEPWIVAVQDKETLSQLRKMNAQIMGSSTDPYYGAPTIILVFADPANANAVKDGSLVLGNMMNAAHSIGLGTCWINREDKMFDTQEGKQIIRKFGLPDDVIGIGALSIGYPDGEIRPAKPRKEGYWRIF